MNFNELMEASEMRKGEELFSEFKLTLEGWKYTGGLDIKNAIYYCVAEFKGKPVFGYLKTDYPSGALVLHKMTYVKYNSFANSDAENGDWICFTNLNNGIVLKNSESTMYFHWNKLVNPMISDYKKAKAAPAKWETTFEADFPDFSKAVITEKSVDFNGTTWGIAEFKKYALACRAIVTKHEKEYGKPN